MIAALGIFGAVLVMGGLGCELITAPDRSKIDNVAGSGGTTTTGGGGTGGTTGGGGTGGVTGGGGTGGTTGTPCETPADCDPPNVCVDATCEMGFCAFAAKPNGPQATQTPGDCKVSQCTNGLPMDVDDDTDLPDDGKDCTLDLCNGGEPAHTNAPADTGCGVNMALKCDGAGNCVDCLAAADCGADNECQQNTCTDGVCGVINAAQGTPLAMQTDGDCQLEQCDGSGSTESVDDNADVPADATACTNDVCVLGVPSNIPVAANTACSEGNGTMCDGFGLCVECVAATDCPGVDDECGTRTCVGGVCGKIFAPANTQVSSQTVKDCKKNVCDGAGTIVVANDDTDLPDDNNACTTDTCSMGTPTFTNKASGTSCGGALVCDGGGQCVGCNAPADCAGVDDECKVRTCVANVCGFNFTANGTAVAMQTANDCKKNVCDGSGNVVNQNDGADLPLDDGNQCTSEACSAGVPTHPAEPVDTACTQNGGSFCSAAGACVACNAAAQCPGSDTECQTRTCSANTCGFSFQPNGFATPTQVSGDCLVRQCDGAGSFVQANANGDVPADDGNQCTDEICTAGVPSHPAKALNSTCSQNGGTFCSAVGTCVQCNAAAQCAGSDTDCQTRTCNANACGFNFQPNGTPTSSQTTGDCKENQCNGSGGIVAANKDTDLPADDGNQCTDEVCTSGVASHPAKAVDTVCSQNGGSFCSAAGACVQCNAPAQCPGSDTECQSRTCNANACGTSFQPNGHVVATQTAGDCKENQCDGAGATVPVNKDNDFPVDGNQCTDDLCNLGVPSNPSVPNGTSCSQNGGTNCNAGTCVAAACNDGLKNGTETDVDCGGSCAPCALTKVCLLDVDCASGACSNNVCVECNTAATCPGADTACQTRTCNAHVCGFDFQPNGTVIASQTTGDCQENQCNGAGGIVSVAKNTDLPADDGNQCTDDTCVAGAPVHPAKAVDTACNQNGGTFCSAAGACVQCNAPAQCAGSDTACQTRTCNANTCGFDFQPNGTVIASQTTGDCQENQCNGAGGIVSVAKNTDVPADDGNQCTDDTCVAGAPVHPPTAADTACNQNGGSFCDGASACVQCNVGAQCPGTDTACQTRSCAAHTCGFTFQPNGTVIASQTPGDCQENQCDGAGGIVTVAQNADLPADDGFECTFDTCLAGAPAHPNKPADTTCSQAGGAVCNGAGACVQCNVASQCAGTDTECQTRTCSVVGACGFNFTASGFVTSSQTSGDCQENQCNGAGAIVQVAKDTDLPADDGLQCTGEACTSGVASHPPVAVGTTCSQSGGIKCDGLGACVPLPAVATTTPSNGAVGVAATTTIAVTFTKAMSPATLTAQTSLGACTGSIQVSSDGFASCIAFAAAAPTMSGGNTVATLTPAPALSFATTYQIRVLSSAADAVGLTMAADFTTATGFTTATDFVSGSSVVISQVYGGGGNTGAPFQRDFVEIHNRGSSDVAIGGWSVQLTSSAGTTWTVRAIPAGTILAAGKYFLFEESAGAGNGVPLPTPDMPGGTFTIGSGSGKVALVTNTTALTGACPSGAQIIDLIGWGSGANCFETAAGSATANATAAVRKNAGCEDAGNNSADFAITTPTPRSTASAPALVCSVSVNEKNVATELDFCNLQFPTTLSVQTGMASPTVYAQAYEAGVTDPAGPAANLIAQIGYGPQTVNPETQSGWTWTAATFNTNVSNNDEWQASFTAPAVGAYFYTSRFSFDGVQWTYCDLNGAGSNAGQTFQVSQLPTLTVTP